MNKTQLRYTHPRVITKQQHNRKPLWCFIDKEVVSFTALSKREIEKIGYRLRQVYQAAQNNSNTALGSETTGSKERLEGLNSIIDINLFNKTSKLSSQTVKRHRKDDTLVETHKKMILNSKQSCSQDINFSLALEEWYDVSDEPEDQNLLPDTPNFGFKSPEVKDLNSEFQANSSRIQSFELQNSIPKTQALGNPSRFSAVRKSLSSRIIELFDFSKYLQQRIHPKDPSFICVSEDAASNLNTNTSNVLVSPQDKPENLLNSKSISRLMTNYLISKNIPFKVTLDTNCKKNITTCKIFTDHRLTCSAKHSSRKEARKLASAHCMKILAKDVLIQYINIKQL